jgi:ElaB/YqjD/DUF883 family membrane-anchored ribosome-binding protein
MNTKTLKPTTDIVDHAQDFTRAASSIVSDLKTEASSRLDGLRDEAGSRFSDAQDTASDAFDTLKGFIKDHPIAAVGFGVAAGLLLASWVRSR